MIDIPQLNRRSFLIGLALTVAFAPISIRRSPDTHTLDWDPKAVDWDNVINEVVGHRNRLVAGVLPEPAPFGPRSPQWCMEKAMDDYFDIT